MTTAGAGLDSSAWRRLCTLLALIIAGGAASWAVGLPLPTTARGWVPVLLTVALAAAAWAWVLPRLVPSLTPRLGLLAAVGAVTGWYLVSPLFIDRMVDEQLPRADAPAAAPAAGTTEGPADTEATEADTAATDGAAATGPERLAVGTFQGIGHQASGMAALYELADGQHVVRLEGIDIQNGPDLFVYLVPQPGQSDDAGGVNLGRLKGNQGSHNYPVPADVDTDDFATVLVWCRAFATPFANATLAVP